MPTPVPVNSRCLRVSDYLRLHFPDDVEVSWDRDKQMFVDGAGNKQGVCPANCAIVSVLVYNPEVLGYTQRDVIVPSDMKEVILSQDHNAFSALADNAETMFGPRSGFGLDGPKYVLDPCLGFIPLQSSLKEAISGTGN